MPTCFAAQWNGDKTTCATLVR